MATRATIRTRARTRADQTNSTKPTDTEYNLFIDEGCKEVWGDLLMAGWPLDYTEATVTATGAATYTIGTGTGIFSIIGVYANSPQFTELRRVNQADVARLRTQAVQSNCPSFYEVRVSPTAGMVVEFYPRPTSGTFAIQYQIDHPGLAADGTIWYGPERSDELVVLKTASKALHNEGMDQDAWALEKEYERLLAKVQVLASWVDQRNSAHIRDVMSQPSRSAFDFDVAGPGYMA